MAFTIRPDESMELNAICRGSRGRDLKLAKRLRS
jgi:hypothetical protein